MFGRKKTPPIDSYSSATSSEKEWRLIERVVMANTAELKRGRRWGIFFKLVTFLYLFIVLGVYLQNSVDLSDHANSSDHTAVIDIDGVISASDQANADAIIANVRRALSHHGTKALVLRINSPGGSPVQSAYVYDEIRRLRAIYTEIPIYAVIVDTGASGAYFIASAADEIYANGASVVGSIGVTAAGFGFQGLIEKLGIERREFTSGEHKAFLDPFSEVDPEEQALFEALLNDVHEQFIEAVKVGRGDRLVETEDTFSGLFWTGSQALELGLIDGLKSTGQLARDIGHPSLVDFTNRPSPFEQFADRFGASVAANLVTLLKNDQLGLR